MPRRARQKSNSGIYHVMLRGINRSTIFHDDEDCEKFLQVLGNCLRSGSSGGSGGFGDSSLVPPYGCDKETVPYAGCDKVIVPYADAEAKVYLYCLMGNHVHLLLREGREGLSTLMKRIGVRFASYYNWKYQRTGHLFQDRFRSEPVDDDAYFLAVYRYIALNPVKAGLCGEAGKYRWCGYRGYGDNSGGSGDSSLVLPCGCDKLTVPYAELPVDITAEQLDAFIRSEQPNIHPFPERISDREAEQILRSVTGLDSAASFIRLPKAEQIRFLYILLENDLSIQQMVRLTGIAKSNIARHLA